MKFRTVTSRYAPETRETEFSSGLENLTTSRPEFHSYTPDGPEPVSELRARLSGKRVAVLTHPAGVDSALNTTVEHLCAWRESLPEKARFTLSALFGPQHGFAGEKQDNMIESSNDTDPLTGVPVFSLYGDTRRVTDDMASHFDVLLFDLQDTGVRVYTFLTTLSYLVEDFARWPEKELCILDRPNPTGRAVEGLKLERGHESFVGSAPIPMQHGLTPGEFALWYREKHQLSSDISVVPMSGYSPDDPQSAWPRERVWIPPSPNMPGLHTARAYPGTVLLEGTWISEARGTTRPLSMFGHPQVDWRRVREAMDVFAPEVTEGCRLRRVTFEPTFHKHAGIPTGGYDIVCEYPFYDPDRFRPWRLMVSVLRAVRECHPQLSLWTDPPYEYEYDRAPIDVICGGPRVRQWVDMPVSDTRDVEQSAVAGLSWREFDRLVSNEEQEWTQESRRFYLYGEAYRGETAGAEAFGGGASGERIRDEHTHGEHPYDRGGATP